MARPISASALMMALALACLAPPEVLAAAPAAVALKIAPANIDATVHAAMRAFQLPGLALAVIKDGKTLYAKSYGVREIGKPERIDGDTLFQIGSTTKAFTATALAILVDEGKLRWDDKVITFLPEFAMSDPYVTREFTVRDLLSHRSGLGLGAGDLMFFPSTDMRREELIAGLRHLKPVSGFRAEYAYDNLLYMVAGEVVARVSGASWEEFVKARIFAPLGMHACVPAVAAIAPGVPFASPHVRSDGTVRAIAVGSLDVIGAAGSISCNLTGMTAWLKTQLATGITPSGTRLFEAERAHEMWALVTPTPASPVLEQMYRVHFSGYGLGWEVSDTRGYKRVFHNGAVPGSVSWISLIPEQGLGVVILANQDSGAALEAIGGQILDAYLNAPRRNWVRIASALVQQREADGNIALAAADSVSAAAPPPPLPLSAYSGTYHDPWRGDISVREDGGQLLLKFSRTSLLEGRLLPYSGNTFIVRWNERSLKADAFVQFSQDASRTITGATMAKISPDTDFSFDFQDLRFTRTK